MRVTAAITGGLLAASAALIAIAPASSASASTAAAPAAASTSLTVGFEQCRRGGGYPVRRDGYWWCEGGRYDGQRIQGG
ncbi:hypothetical protein [Streptosporangium jomthongense]|uniref:Uncharacterized protein n=1 Tax=Streptosporangium jomthongense TaxID=1193683 RepID=A0ABV8F627_9ACTN